ncbi:ral guanine nucleotide dissociation stimulator-like [Apodemus sylvaticus]|uniref:ral guanine nucleotide dissociation stimulator-like n=1 Tax=Apodemus sylvaticus TaxID=10129 RepID=UPI002244CD02|nr:ral guanine nucleotide dissociation stimulator-like [Apodemus sylvaticus]
MFSCVRTSSGSGHKKAKSGRLGNIWRRWIHTLTHFWHVSRRDPEVCPQNKKKTDSLPKPPRFNYRTTEYIEQMVAYLPTAVRYNDHLSISIFLTVYHKYVTTWEVLDLIMTMYASFQSDSVEDQQTKSDIFSFLSHWFEKFPDSFCEAPDMAVVRRLMTYVKLNVPSEEVHARVTELLSVLEEEEAKKLKLEKACATPAEPPVQDASAMQESLTVRPASEAEPQGDLPPREDTALLETTLVEPFEPEDDPVQLPSSDPALPTSPDTQSPTDMVADVAADVSAARHVFISAFAQLGAPECVFPLPEVDM